MTDNALQTDEELDSELETGEENTGAGLASAAGEDQSKNSGGNDEGAKQEKVNAAINKQHFKYREEERKRIAAEQRAADAEKRLSELEAASSEITIPPMPDTFDEQYEAKVAAREDAIRRKAEQEAQKEQATIQREENEKAAEQAKTDAFNAKAETYKGRFAALGVTPEEMQQAGTVVAEYLADQSLVEFVLEHENGPLITKYLAANPLELHELSMMNPIQAATKLQSDIIPAANLLKPQAPGAPDPIEEIHGRGGGDKGSPFTKGATFE